MFISNSAVGCWTITRRAAKLKLTCDQASLIFFYRGGKVRLIQLLEYLSVASPESGLFSDWPRNKKVLRTEP